MKDLNVRPEIKKLLEENTGSTLFDKRHSKILFYPPPRVMDGEGNGTPLQYSCLENPMGRGAW